MPAGWQIEKGGGGQKVEIDERATTDLINLFVEAAEGSADIRANERLTAAGLNQSQQRTLLATQQAITTYFGMPNEQSVSSNRALYKEATNATQPLSAFHANHTAVCTEFAVGAYQLLQLVGLGDAKVEFVSGVAALSCTVTADGDTVGYPGDHAFILIYDIGGDGSEERGVIYDPANPALKADNTWSLYLAPIDPQQLHAFRRGSEVVARGPEDDIRRYGLL